MVEDSKGEVVGTEYIATVVIHANKCPTVSIPPFHKRSADRKSKISKNNCAAGFSQPVEPVAKDLFSSIASRLRWCDISAHVGARKLVQGGNEVNGLMTQPSNLSAAASKKLEETMLRVCTPSIAFELWQKVFSYKETARLGGDFEIAYRKGGSVAMWSTVHGCTQVRAVIDIAHTLNLLTTNDRRWLLKETGELLDDDAAYDHAVLNNDLVLNSFLQAIHWKGEQIEFDWAKHEAKWWFMWNMARHAKTGLSIDHTVFGERKKPSWLSKTKSEIVNLECFPITLGDAIVSAGAGAQKLEVAAEEIRLFEHHVDGEIREWTP
ncbi:hypothetical protein [Novipirellula sp.]|uniref:hypothetical protein n=1 Tax=Novipirellula sp. TaxID=2795430 RepID=UPI003567E5B5